MIRKSSLFQFDSKYLHSVSTVKPALSFPVRDQPRYIGVVVSRSARASEHPFPPQTERSVGKGKLHWDERTRKLQKPVF